MLDVVQRPKDTCVYEIRQKGQNDPCYVVVPNPKVRFIFIYIRKHYECDSNSENG